MFLKNTLQAYIPRRSAHCDAGGEPLVPNAEYVSYLLNEEDNWKRHDYCINCWRSIEKQKKEEGGSYWKGKIPAKKEVILSQDEKALKLFRSLAIDPESPHRKLLMVLTLYLERKKQIARRVEMKDRRNLSIHYYEVLETGEVFSIASCSLSREDSEKMIDELKTLFC